MKTNPKQLASVLHFWKGPLNKAALAQRAAYDQNARIKPIKKGHDYETRSTVEEPRCCEDYKRMANGELRRLDHKRRDVHGKSYRRWYIKSRQLNRNLAMAS